MVGLALSDKLKGSLRKGMMVGATAGVLSVLVLDGLNPINMFNMQVPKVAAHVVILGTSSVAADYIIPKITPYIAGGDAQWTRFETLALQPMLIGIISLAAESVIAPEVQQRGNVLRTIAVGGASAITSSYVASGMGWTTLV